MLRVANGAAVIHGRRVLKEGGCEGGGGGSLNYLKGCSIPSYT